MRRQRSGHIINISSVAGVVGLKHCAAYAPEGTAHDMWSRYHGTQPGDPAKLGDALVKIAAMPNPPKTFVAGSDALDVIRPAIEERLREARANEMLSKSTVGSF